MASPPAWLVELANKAAAEIQPVDGPSPISCHFFYSDDPIIQWEVSLFASGTEIVGGKLDGALRPTKFTVNLQNLFDILCEVSSFHWQALSMGDDDELGPHISVEGTYQGHSVWLRLLSHPPRRFQTRDSAEANEILLEDI